MFNILRRIFDARGNFLPKKVEGFFFKLRRIFDASCHLFIFFYLLLFFTVASNRDNSTQILRRNIFRRNLSTAN